MAVRGGRILGVGTGVCDPAAWGDDSSARRRLREFQLGPVVLMPGLVNAHTHLELSSLRGRVPPASSLPEWVGGLLRERAAFADSPSAAAAGLDEAEACGTAGLADTSNSLVSCASLVARRLPAVVFHEVLGFDPALVGERVAAAIERVARNDPAVPHVRVKLAPHAPYSTSAELIRAVVKRMGASWPPVSIHVAESADEVELLASGGGAWRRLLEDFGVLPATWTPPGESPVNYLDGLGLWKPGALAVHGVHMSDPELRLLAARDVTLVTCPRSNRWVGSGDPPIARFAASGVRIAVGTDSLASAPDLNVFGELARLRELAPALPARAMLAWATINGARALGLERDIGSLAKGRVGRILSVAVPSDTLDPEEALLHGVDSGDLTWVGEWPPSTSSI